MGAVTAALYHAAVAAGAEVRTGVEVTAVGDGEVRFEDESGAERSVGARWTLANVAPAELDRLRGRAPPGRDRRRGLAAEGQPPALAAAAPARPGRRSERAFAGTFHVNETGEQLQAAYADAAAGRIPSHAPCEAYCHTLSDPSILGNELAAAGAHTLTVFGLHMPARLFEHGDAARPAALAATLRSLDAVLAEPIADCVMRAPDGEPCIDVHTPADLEHELRMPRGHIFHGDLAWPFADDPDDVGRWGVETDDPAILVCGAGARRGGGVSGIPGRNAAMAVLAGPR